MILDATTLHPARLEPPPSKSDAHRALTLAWMLKLPEPTLTSWPTDVRRLSQGLRLLGTGQPIDCGDGAAPFRILTALAAVHPGHTVLTGSARLRERPHAPLLTALGLQASWPLNITGRRYTSFSIEGALSSQYASALTLAACRIGPPFDVELIGPTASRGYLDLTLRWARSAGFVIDDTERRIRVLDHHPVASLPPIPPDWSSLGYLLLMAKASGAEVDTQDPSPHPDRAILDYLHRDGFEADVAPAPDLAPTLAALALASTRACVLRHTDILRHKESDRLAGIVDLAAAVGATTRQTGDALELTPARRPARFDFDCRNDHRLTLAAVSLACLFRCRAELTRTEGVDKSFPGFFEQASRIGVTVS